VNPATCLFKVTGSGTYKLGNGTGHYKGVHGSGKLTLLVMAIDARAAKGTCTSTKPPVAYQEILTLQGLVSL
jgi:hypothetical protein